MEKISSDVRELGYPDFKLPDPKEELKQLNDLKKTDTQTKKSSHPINNMKYMMQTKEKQTLNG